MLVCRLCASKVTMNNTICCCLFLSWYQRLFCYSTIIIPPSKQDPSLLWPKIEQSHHITLILVWFVVLQFLAYSNFIGQWSQYICWAPFFLSLSPYKNGNQIVIVYFFIVIIKLSNYESDRGSHQSTNLDKIKTNNK